MRTLAPAGLPTTIRTQCHRRTATVICTPRLHSTRHLASRTSQVCHAKAADSAQALNNLRQAMAGGSMDPTYTNGSAYLKTIGFTNPAEVARVLDIAMNPNSLFISYDGKRSKNASARPLDVVKDMAPVVDFLRAEGVPVGDVVKVIAGHPPVLSYSVEERLEPFWQYLKGLGIEVCASVYREDLGAENVAAAVISRPSLLGLEVNANLRKIVDYLQYIETPPETIVKYLLESI